MKLNHLLKILESKNYFYPFIIFAISFFLRFLYIISFEAEIIYNDDPWYYLRIANNILNGKGYIEGNLYAYRPPLYSYFIALVFYFTDNNINITRLIQSILSSFSCVGIYFIGKKLSSKNTGLIAGMFCAIYPQLINYSVQLCTEQLFLFFIIFGLLCFIISYYKKNLLVEITAGFLFGLASLTREAGLFFIFGILIWLIFKHKKITTSLKKWWLIALISIITISPWAVRNYLIFNKFVPIATNGGINFYMGNNPEATGSFNWILPPGVEWNKESKNGFYEIQANSLGYKKGFEFIKKNPSRAIKLLSYKLYYLLSPPYESISFEESKIEVIAKIIWLIMYLFLFITTFFIAPFFLKKNIYFFILNYIIIILFTLPYLMAYSLTRYRLPMIPFMALISASVLQLFIEKKFKISKKIYLKF
ncbi:MAG: glycosyltransferase family 39 protein [candidate division Zixibacteria bacterium]|nr:glycosyltransferase family 39 protein [candidate division Zixibacteria bacterium]MDD5427422.1 glycosyltransferase family 39 protein [candidate division Zixibacteria bacterium]